MIYEIVFALSPEDLIRNVNIMLKNGYKCQGGVAVLLKEFTMIPDIIWCYQAMIKEEKEKENV